MAQLPAPLHVTDALRIYAEPFPAYARTEGRWDVYDIATARQPGEAYDAYVQRATLAALHWEKEDATAASAPADAAPAVAKRPPGRPMVHPVVEGESAPQRRARLAREARAARRGVRLTDAQLLDLCTRAWWAGVEAGRGGGEPPEAAQARAWAAEATRE